METIKRHVAVIGAGPSGLGTAKCLMEEGHSVVVFEKSDRLGGLWDYREDRPGGVYETTQFQTSKYISSFSDFPMSEDTSVFPMHWEILKYLKEYASQFNLETLIEFETEVRRVTQSGERWLVELSKKDEVRVDEFDAIAICTGEYWTPVMPDIPGQEKFRGKIMHSANYSNNASLSGKNVVVVGSGVTGMDIAVDASRVAADVQWSVRTKNWIRPRWFGLIPYESGVAQGVHLPREELLALWKEWIPEHYEDFLNSGLVPDKAPFAEGIGANDEILGRIREKQITVKSPVKELTEARCVFEDGSEVDADVVVLATGYESFSYPFLDSSVLTKLNIHDEGMDLYYHLFHPELPNCAFIFAVAGNAPAFPTLELQARWFAAVLSGSLQLPEREQMWAEIAEEVKTRKKELNKTRYRSNFIDGAYLVKLASKIGVLPDKITHFDEYMKLISPPSFPYIYRVYGPHCWSEARQEIEDTKKKYLVKMKHDGELRKQTLLDCSKLELLQMYKNSQISRAELAETLGVAG